ncbi:hypothetical protein KFL_005330010 [Klebsormidium nitens]|uniref:Uncharacterized protein n=1 Tax=Klebsormidium nitens TaxID=105231 RepID=A0A1Y1IL86_KLENI|nr:hypothetical protein KFL_005330010 [Klebsormidium nitens]|eukprot:GAQ89526.1 hypothetical protein KFL_005330010 [Klebsormidium nitens]
MPSLASGTPPKGRAREILDELSALEGHKHRSPSGLLKRRSSRSPQFGLPVSVVKHAAERKVTGGATSPLSMHSISAKPSFFDGLSAVNVHKIAVSLDTERDEGEENGSATGGAQLVRVMPAERDTERSVPVKSTSRDNTKLHTGERTDTFSDSQRAGSVEGHSVDPSFVGEEQRAKATASLLRRGTISQTTEVGRTDLASEVIRLQDESAAAHRSSEAAHQAAAALQKAVDESRSQACLLKKEAELANQAADVSRQEADEAKAEVEELRGSLEEMQMVVQMMKDASKSQEEGISQEVVRLNTEVRDERKKRKAAEGTCIELQKEVDRLHQENEDARLRLESLQESEDARASASDQLTAAQAANDALEQELKRCQKKLSELSRQDKDSELRLRNIEEENEGLSAANAKLLKKVKSLGLKVDALRAGVGPDLQEDADHEARITKLQVRKQALKARVRELESQLLEADDECREARTKYISLGIKVEELLQEEALTQELVMQEKDRGRISLEEQLEQARAVVQALKERNAVLERGLAASEEELVRQSRWANHTASQLQQSLVKLTHLERIDGGTVRMNGMELESYAEMIELQANEVRRAAEECASAQHKASVLESGFLQLRALCDELQCELVRSAREAEFWRNAAEEAERGRKDAREEAAQAIEKSIRLERLLEERQLEICLRLARLLLCRRISTGKGATYGLHPIIAQGTGTFALPAETKSALSDDHDDSL